MPNNDQLLNCYCWCGRTVKPIPARDVLNGETHECSATCRATFEANGFRPSWTALGNSTHHHGTEGRWAEGCRCRPCVKNHRSARKGPK
jgi:hypothetical protein